MAVAVGDPGSIERTTTDVPSHEDSDISLLRSADLIREYQNLVVDLQRRYGQGLDIESQQAAATMEVRVLQTLAEQEERILRDEDPSAPAPSERAALLNADYVAARLVAFDVPPTIAGRLARRLAQRRVRQRGGDAQRPSPDVAPER